MLTFLIYNVDLCGNDGIYVRCIRSHHGFNQLNKLSKIALIILPMTNYLKIKVLKTRKLFLLGRLVLLQVYGTTESYETMEIENVWNVGKAIERNAPHGFYRIERTDWVHGLSAQGLSAHFWRKMCAQSVHSVIVCSVRALSPCIQSLCAQSLCSHSCAPSSCSRLCALIYVILPFLYHLSNLI